LITPLEIRRENNAWRDWRQMLDTDEAPEFFEDPDRERRLADENPTQLFYDSMQQNRKNGWAFDDSRFPLGKELLNTIWNEALDNLLRAQYNAADEAGFRSKYSLVTHPEDDETLMGQSREREEVTAAAMMGWGGGAPKHGNYDLYMQDKARDLQGADGGQTNWSSYYRDTQYDRTTAQSWEELQTQLDVIDGYKNRTDLQKNYIAQKRIARYWMDMIINMGGSNDFLEHNMKGVPGSTWDDGNRTNFITHRYAEMSSDRAKELGRSSTEGLVGQCAPWSNAGEGFVPQDDHSYKLLTEENRALNDLNVQQVADAEHIFEFAMRPENVLEASLPKELREAYGNLDKDKDTKEDTTPVVVSKTAKEKAKEMGDDSDKIWVPQLGIYLTREKYDQILAGTYQWGRQKKKSQEEVIKQLGKPDGLKRGIRYMKAHMTNYIYESEYAKYIGLLTKSLGFNPLLTEDQDKVDRIMKKGGGGMRKYYINFLKRGSFATAQNYGSLTIDLSRYRTGSICLIFTLTQI